MQKPIAFASVHRHHAGQNYVPMGYGQCLKTGEEVVILRHALTGRFHTIPAADFHAEIDHPSGQKIPAFWVGDTDEPLVA